MCDLPHNDALPFVSVMKMNTSAANKNMPPLMHISALSFTHVWAAMIGAVSPAIRFIALKKPLVLALMGAGTRSGT